MGGSMKRSLVDLIDDPEIRNRVARVCQQRDDAINAATVMSVALRRITPPNDPKIIKMADELKALADEWYECCNNIHDPLLRAEAMLRALNTRAHPAPEASAGGVDALDWTIKNAREWIAEGTEIKDGVTYRTGWAIRLQELLDALAHTPDFDASRDRAVEAIEIEARRYAGMYPEGSNGRNTFVIFADAVQRIALAAIQPQGERGEGVS